MVETQYFVLRVAWGLAESPGEVIRFCRLMASLAYLPSSPTLFNSGTRHTQMSSWYLVDSPRDDLDSIYSRYAQVAKLPRFARRGSGSRSRRSVRAGHSSGAGARLPRRLERRGDAAVRRDACTARASAARYRCTAATVSTTGITKKSNMANCLRACSSWDTSRRGQPPSQSTLLWRTA